MIRPADIVETAEAWDVALKTNGPTVLALSRQGLKAYRSETTNKNLVSYGGYSLNNISKDRDITLIATGSEIEIAMEASEIMYKEGVKAAVVSLPCWEIFDKQSEEYKNQVLGNCPRIAIEAASEMGWSKYVGERGIFIGMKSFGASGPASDLYNHFKITSKSIIDSAKLLLK